MTLHALAVDCGTDKGAHQGFMKFYERYLPGPDKPITLVELGVYEGKSLQLWSKYFRHNASRFYGLDISYAHYQSFLDSRVSCLLADQADPVQPSFVYHDAEVHP